MAKSRVFKKTGPSGDVEFNMTPMIDVTFQLIIFFILAGQIASTALAKMELPKPDRSQALRPKEADVANKVIVNVLSKGIVGEDVDPFLAGEVARYQVGQRMIHVGKEAELTTILRSAMEPLPESGRKEFFVEIRADRRVHFGGVEPVILAAAEAGVLKMNLTALLDLGG